MMLMMVIWVVFVLLFLFACSIANFVNHLPNCKTATREGIERSFVEMGYFINFKPNTKILRDKMDLLTKCIQELEARTLSMEGAAKKQAHMKLEWMFVVQEEGVLLCDEAAGIINNHWHRGWTKCCYIHSHRIAEKISKINHILDPTEFVPWEPYTQDGIPGIIVVVLIAYSLTNALLHLPYSTTATNDVTDWIVLEMVYPFMLKANLKTLRTRIDKLRASTGELNPELAGRQVSRKVALLEEGVKLSDEATHIINHWCKGWCGLRYRLSKRVEVLIMKIDNELYCLWPLCGYFARGAISSIDKISDTLPTAIMNFRHYLHFNTNFEALSSKIQHLQQLNSSTTPPLQISEEEEEDLNWPASLEAAKKDAMRLIHEVERVDKYWYKRWSGSRYRLSKRIVKTILQVDKVLKPVWLRHDDGGAEEVFDFKSLTKICN